MSSGLEHPGSADELYLARADEVREARPLLTGDVLAGVDIPGVDGDASMAVILAHPCTMRRGSALSPKILVARVDERPRIELPQWPEGHFRVMPLPGLQRSSSGTHDPAGLFDEIGMVPSGALSGQPRLACLSRIGINLLQQRFIWYLTRLAVPTPRLDEAAAAVFEEVDLAEEWISVKMERGMRLGDANEEFHQWIRASDASGLSRQEGLSSAQRLSTIRRDLRQELSGGPDAGATGATPSS